MFDLSRYISRPSGWDKSQGQREKESRCFIVGHEVREDIEIDHINYYCGHCGDVLLDERRFDFDTLIGRLLRRGRK